MPAVRFEEFKAHLNLTSNRDDAEALRMLEAAEQWVRRRGIPVGAGTVTFRVPATGGALVLPAVRLASIVSVHDPMALVYTAPVYDVDLVNGIIRVPWWIGGYWTVVATYAAGPVDPDVDLAVKIIGKHLFETQRGAGQREGSRPGFGGAGASEAPSVPSGFAIPKRALELLEPLMPPVLA